MTKIGIKIAELRKQVGLTQQELADKVGYKSKSAINKIELGLRDISQSKIILFADALNVEPSVLLGYNKKNLPQDEKDLSEGEMMLLDLFNKVPAEKQKLVIEMIRVALGNLE